MTTINKELLFNKTLTSLENGRHSSLRKKMSNEHFKPTSMTSLLKIPTIDQDEPYKTQSVSNKSMMNTNPYSIV